MVPVTLFHDLKQLLQTDQPAHLDSARRSSALSLAEIDKRVGAALRGAKVTPSVEGLFRSLIYLWHDHLDESHRIAQEIENQDGSLVHGIMHRREPDYSNAKYWFRHAGAHPAFLSLALRAGELLARHDEGDLQSRLIPNKTWDPFAFVDAVEDATSGTFSFKIPLLEQAQALEFECAIENLIHRL